MSTPTIAVMFHQWLDMTYKAPHKPTPGSEQYKQLRFAFFSGAASYHLAVRANADASEEAAVARLERYETEITGFLDSEREDFNKANGKKPRA